MNLLSYLKEERIIVPLKGSSKVEVIRELTERVLPPGQSSESLVQAVLEREAQGSTGLGQGIGVPHARTSQVIEPLIVLGVSPEGVDFEALDGQGCHLFFLILIPPEQSSLHIQFLGTIAGFSRDRELCRKLIASEEASEVMELLSERLDL